jgi:hypothetical protein
MAGETTAQIVRRQSKGWTKSAALSAGETVATRAPGGRAKLSLPATARRKATSSNFTIFPAN